MVGFERRGNQKLTGCRGLTEEAVGAVLRKSAGLAQVKGERGLRGTKVGRAEV